MRFVGTNNQSEKMVKVEFNVFKFNNRPKPEDPNRITIVSCLSEFGCEIIGCLYCLPKIFQERPGDYKIVVGWYGREYLYRHLADEFWEVKEEYQWLRDYCKAFHNDSKNLNKLELALRKYGKAVPASDIGRLVVGNECHDCKNFWGGYMDINDCPQCKSTNITKCLFADVANARKHLVPIPKPSPEKMAEADKYLKPNPVGIFARGRTTYGRNLQPEFYVKLIAMLESMGYNPVWLGEKQSTAPCPVDHIFDYSRSPQARDLELTCAIVSKCKFTIQYWTASTRIAALMGTPYILFESPMQIYGEGQEGYRLGLLKDLAPMKMVISHFLNVKENHDEAIKLTRRAVTELIAGNFRNIIGMVEDYQFNESSLLSSKNRVGF